MATQHLNAMQRLQRAGDTQGAVRAAQPVASEQALADNAVAAAASTDRLGRAVVWIFGFYLIGKIFYVFSGGSAQPADIILAGLGFVVVSPAAFLSFLRREMTLTLMTIWILLVNLVWFMITAKFDFLGSNLYYVFNLVIVVAALSARWRQIELFDRVVPWMIGASVLIETLFLRVGGSGGMLRSIGTFRNPNQLAYWGIIVLSLLLVLRRNKPRLIDVPVMLMVLYCEVAAASRAGLISTLVLIMIWAWFYLSTPTKRLMGMALGTLLIVGVYTSNNILRAAESGAESSAIGERLQNDNDESQVEERNYDRLYRFYQYTVLGSGEGQISRFVRQGQANMEIHSTFGTLLFSYGIPGLGLFLLFIVTIFRRVELQFAVYLLPALLYGVTHQGLRFTLFWALVGIMLSMARETSPSLSGTAAGGTAAGGAAPIGRRERGMAFLAERAGRR
ncbi:O-antigen ligase family protein [Sphingomonas hylomeconis]|uniref:O-antigen ligase family protein n=2 Tax=Sphingomonas hylomeconis TaxID=1395958 RepID=A0ABV7ST55_9SPHN